MTVRSLAKLAVTKQLVADSLQLAFLGIFPVLAFRRIPSSELFTLTFAYRLNSFITPPVSSTAFIASLHSETGLTTRRGFARGTSLSIALGFPATLLTALAFSVAFSRISRVTLVLVLVLVGLTSSVTGFAGADARAALTPSRAFIAETSAVGLGPVLGALFFPSAIGVAVSSAACGALALLYLYLRFPERTGNPVRTFGPPISRVVAQRVVQSAAVFCVAGLPVIVAGNHDRTFGNYLGLGYSFSLIPMLAATAANGWLTRTTMDVKAVSFRFAQRVMASAAVIAVIIALLTRPVVTVVTGSTMPSTMRSSFVALVLGAVPLSYWHARRSTLDGLPGRGWTVVPILFIGALSGACGALASARYGSYSFAPMSTCTATLLTTALAVYDHRSTAVHSARFPPST